MVHWQLKNTAHPFRNERRQSAVVAASVKVYYYQIRKVTTPWLKTSQRIEWRRRLDLTGNRIFLKSPNCYLSSCNTEIIGYWCAHSTNRADPDRHIKNTKRPSFPWRNAYHPPPLYQSFKLRHLLLRNDRIRAIFMFARVY